MVVMVVTVIMILMVLVVVTNCGGDVVVTVILMVVVVVVVAVANCGGGGRGGRGGGKGYCRTYRMISCCGSEGAASAHVSFLAYGTMSPRNSHRSHDKVTKALRGALPGPGRIRKVSKSAGSGRVGSG